jgi:hypothetical protein
MKVKELMEQLRAFPEDAEVKVSATVPEDIVRQFMGDGLDGLFFTVTEAQDFGVGHEDERGSWVCCEVFLLTDDPYTEGR